MIRRLLAAVFIFGASVWYWTFQHTPNTSDVAHEVRREYQGGVATCRRAGSDGGDRVWKCETTTSLGDHVTGCFTLHGKDVKDLKSADCPAAE